MDGKEARELQELDNQRVIAVVRLSEFQKAALGCDCLMSIPSPPLLVTTCSNADVLHVSQPQTQHLPPPALLQVSGSSHNCALTCDGRLYSWGNNSQGN